MKIVNKWLILAGILVLLGALSITLNYTTGDQSSGAIFILIGLVIIYLGMYGIPKR